MVARLLIFHVLAVEILLIPHISLVSLELLSHWVAVSKGQQLIASLCLLLKQGIEVMMSRGAIRNVHQILVVGGDAQLELL